MCDGSVARVFRERASEVESVALLEDPPPMPIREAYVVPINIGGGWDISILGMWVGLLGPQQGADIELTIHGQGQIGSPGVHYKPSARAKAGWTFLQIYQWRVCAL